MVAPNNEVLIEAAARLLAAAGGSMPITTLNKALFYLDLLAMRDRGASITGTTYLALPAGPVVAKYDRRLVGALEDAGLAQQDTSETEGTKPVCLLAAPTTAHLDAAQLALVERVGQWASSRTASALSVLSHRNEGWKIAWDNGLGAKQLAQPINLRVAMQQILNADPWIDDAPEGDVKDAFAEADSGTGFEF